MEGRGNKLVDAGAYGDSQKMETHNSQTRPCWMPSKVGFLWNHRVDWYSTRHRGEQKGHLEEKAIPE